MFTDKEKKLHDNSNHDNLISDNQFLIETSKRLYLKK